MNAKEVFGQIIRYFPEGKEDLLYVNMDAFAAACLSAGDFDEAVKYADLMSKQDENGKRRMSACRIKLLAKLRCKNDEEFYHSRNFNRDMPEYLALISTSSAYDPTRLKHWVNLANKNETTVKEDIEEEQRALEIEQERERNARLAAQRAEERRKQRMSETRKIVRNICIYCACFVVATLLLIAGIVIWAVCGDKMPYVLPTPVIAMFVTAAACYIGGGIYCATLWKNE